MQYKRRAVAFLSLYASGKRHAKTSTQAAISCCCCNNERWHMFKGLVFCRSPEQWERTKILWQERAIQALRNMLYKLLQRRKNKKVASQSNYQSGGEKQGVLQLFLFLRLPSYSSIFLGNMLYVYSEEYSIHHWCTSYIHKLLLSKLFCVSFCFLLQESKLKLF